MQPPWTAKSGTEAAWMYCVLVVLLLRTTSAPQVCVLKTNCHVKCDPVGYELNEAWKLISRHPQFCLLEPGMILWSILLRRKRLATCFRHLVGDCTAAAFQKWWFQLLAFLTGLLDARLCWSNFSSFANNDFWDWIESELSDARSELN